MNFEATPALVVFVQMHHTLESLTCQKKEKTEYIWTKLWYIYWRQQKTSDRLTHSNQPSNGFEPNILAQITVNNLQASTLKRINVMNIRLLLENIPKWAHFAHIQFAPVPHQMRGIEYEKHHKILYQREKRLFEMHVTIKMEEASHIY